MQVLVEDRRDVAAGLGIAVDDHADEFLVPVADPASVGVVGGPGVLPLHDRRIQVGVDAPAVVGQHRQADLGDLVGGVVLELEGVGDPGAQAGVHVEEVLHLVGVAGEDHHDVAAVVLHEFEDGVDGLGSVAPAPGLLVEAVCLVDEQDAAERALEDGAGLLRRLPDVR